MLLPQVKSDLFNKITGAIRNVTALEQAAFFQKVYTASTAAKAERDYEMSLLQVTAASAWK